MYTMFKIKAITNLSYKKLQTHFMYFSRAMPIA